MKVPCWLWMNRESIQRASFVGASVTTSYLSMFGWNERHIRNYDRVKLHSRFVNSYSRTNGPANDAGTAPSGFLLVGDS